MRERDIARDLARGVLAGLVATAAMTLSQAAEMRATGREPSTTPAQALCKMIGFETRSDEAERRLANRVHWAYGTMWGLGQLALRRVPEPLRTLLFFATVWGAGTTLLTRAKLSPPPTEMDAATLLPDLGHHAVYATTSSLAAHTLERAS